MNLRSTLLLGSSKATLTLHNAALIRQEKANLATYIQHSNIGDFVTIHDKTYEIVSVDEKGQPILKPYIRAEE